jgi:DNA-binding CsgD family transcriptional regulator
MRPATPSGDLQNRSAVQFERKKAMPKAKVHKRNTGSARHRQDVKLVPKELRILKWCAKGYSMEETADRLNMSRHGVDWYWRRILLKLRAKSATNAVYKALSQGLIG